MSFLLLRNLLTEAGPTERLNWLTPEIRQEQAHFSVHVSSCANENLPGGERNFTGPSSDANDTIYSCSIARGPKIRSSRISRPTDFADITNNDQDDLQAQLVCIEIKESLLFCANLTIDLILLLPVWPQICAQKASECIFCSLFRLMQSIKICG